MRLFSWNVNGVRAVSKKGFLDWFSLESPDVLCLQETKAHPEQVEATLKLPKEYFAFWNNPDRRGYAGVAVFTKIKPVFVEKDFPSGKLDTEGRSLVLYFKDFTIINVYFPNGGASPERLEYKLKFYDKFLKFVDNMENRNIIICGDVNTAHKEIDLARPKQNKMISGFLPIEREWLDKVISRGYVDTFRHFNEEGEKYTWWDYKTKARERNVGWRIDYFFATQQMIPRVKNAFILPEVMGSDHCPIGIELNSEIMDKRNK